jgi:hypothetical protein
MDLDFLYGCFEAGNSNGRMSQSGRKPPDALLSYGQNSAMTVRGPRKKQRNSNPKRQVIPAMCRSKLADRMSKDFGSRSVVGSCLSQKLT